MCGLQMFQTKNEVIKLRAEKEDSPCKKEKKKIQMKQNHLIAVGLISDVHNPQFQGLVIHILNPDSTDTESAQWSKCKIWAPAKQVQASQQTLALDGAWMSSDRKNCGLNISSIHSLDACAPGSALSLNEIPKMLRSMHNWGWCQNLKRMTAKVLHVQFQHTSFLYSCIARILHFISLSQDDTQAHGNLWWIALLCCLAFLGFPLWRPR